MSNKISEEELLEKLQSELNFSKEYIKTKIKLSDLKFNLELTVTSIDIFIEDLKNEVEAKLYTKVIVIVVSIPL